MRRAELDPALGIRVIGARELRYDTAASHDEDRPAHVRAASGLAWFGGRLAVIQDDAAFIALIGRDVSAIALPRGASGRRRFEVGLGNKLEKLDLEACVVVPADVLRAVVPAPVSAAPGGGGDELWAFGSGSAPAREKIAVLGDKRLRIVDAAALYRRLRDMTHGDVNIEGAAIVGDELWLFHRGNTGAHDRGPAVVRFDLLAIACWLAATGPSSPIAMRCDRYDLGSAGVCRLGFTDAVAVGDRVFYLAAAEASENAIDDGAVLAAQLGVIRGDRVRACELVIDGAPVKAEGIAFDPTRADHAWLAIDPDDVDEPARLYEIELVGPW